MRNPQTFFPAIVTLLALSQGKLLLSSAAFEQMDKSLFSHILERNKDATVALLDWKGMGKNKQKILDLLAETDLEIIKL